MTMSYIANYLKVNASIYFISGLFYYITGNMLYSRPRVQIFRFIIQGYIAREFKGSGDFTGDTFKFCFQDSFLEVISNHIVMIKLLDFLT
jgi:hypothetical protein